MALGLVDVGEGRHLPRPAVVHVGEAALPGLRHSHPCPCPRGFAQHAPRTDEYRVQYEVCRNLFGRGMGTNVTARCRCCDFRISGGRWWFRAISKRRKDSVERSMACQSARAAAPGFSAPGEPSTHHAYVYPQRAAIPYALIIKLHRYLQNGDTRLWLSLDKNDYDGWAALCGYT